MKAIEESTRLQVQLKAEKAQRGIEELVARSQAQAVRAPNGAEELVTRTPSSRATILDRVLVDSDE